MATRVNRKNEPVVIWLRAIAIATVTWVGLNAMQVRPSWVSIALAALAGVLALATPELGVLAAVIALSVPLVAAQPALGLLLLVLGVVSVRYLGADGGRAFLIVGISVLGAFFGPVWAGVALAGYLLGAGEGALAAAVACVIVEAMGIGLGRQTLGVVVAGGPQAALLAFDQMPATLLSSAWLRESLGSLDTASVNRVVGGLAGITQPLALVVQPALWAAGAATAGLVRAEALRRENSALGLAAGAAGAAVPALGAVLVFTLAGLAVPWTALAVAFASSALVAVGFTLVWEQVFPLERELPACLGASGVYVVGGRRRRRAPAGSSPQQKTSSRASTPPPRSS